MKIQCTNNKNCRDLTVGKIYNVVKEGERYFIIIDNVDEESEFMKHRFKIVKEESEELNMNIKCINSLGGIGGITLGKVYKVIKESTSCYYFENDNGDKNCGYYKNRFEITKEEPEFTLIQALNKIQDGEEYECVQDSYRIKSIKKLTSGIKFSYIKSETYNESLAISDNARFRLKKVIEYMTFIKAKEKGTPKHKNHDYGYGVLSADDFVKEMDKKVWIIEGEE